jgi:hypothetical protein
MKIVGTLIAASVTAGALAVLSCGSSDSPGDWQGGGGQDASGASGSGASAGVGGVAGSAQGGSGAAHTGGSGGTGPAGSGGGGGAAGAGGGGTGGGGTSGGGTGGGGGAAGTGGAETFGSEANPTGNPIGGGPGYTNMVCGNGSTAKYTVSSKTQLLDALSSATSGDVICVTADAEIDLSGTESVTIPGGVILGSDRGLNGSLGGHIFRTRGGGTTPQATFVAGGDNVRITGLRIEGPDSIQDQDLGDDVIGAIRETGNDNLEVDNCEIYDWSYAGVAFENSGPGDWYGTVHHNYFHHCHAKGYGYATAVGFGNVLIEANLYDYTRHAVTGYGGEGERYEVRYCTHGPHCTDTVFDVHAEGTWSGGGLSGRLYRIHHNTSTASNDSALGLAGTPSEGLYFNNNRVETGIYALGGMTRVFVTNNYIGGVFYASGQP